MSRFFHILSSILGIGLVVAPTIEGALPGGKAKTAVAAIGGALLFIADKLKVMGKAA